MPAKVRAILDKFLSDHPTATHVRISTVTRKAVYIHYSRDDIGADGLYVGWFKAGEK